VYVPCHPRAPTHPWSGDAIWLHYRGAPRPTDVPCCHDDAMRESLCTSSVPHRRQIIL